MSSDPALPSYVDRVREDTQNHKPQLEPLDHELFDLIATHASTALYCCALQETVRAS